MMKTSIIRFTVTALLAINCSFLAYAQTAKSVLDKAAASITAKQGVKANFRMTATSGSTNGTIAIKGKKFYATTQQATVWFDGTVEICCHGGILVTETVLAALLSAGARPAGAGEFTKRAFLNGKLGLSAAEALADLLEAQTREQLTLAHHGMQGATEEKCRAVYEHLRHLLASVYVRIDYPDEDLADLSEAELEKGFAECAESLRALVATYRTGHAVAEGIRTVLCGKPNVGKSSLYNRILGRDAAIVTEVEGTTRDVLSETATLGRVTLHLSDTAGIRETGDAVEQIGVLRARKTIEDAELILAVFDGSSEPTEEDLSLIEELQKQTAPVIAVVNKSDLADNAGSSAYYQSVFANSVFCSAKDGTGIEALAALTERLFLDGELNLRQDAVLTNARQYAAAQKALEQTERAVRALREGLPIDLCCRDAEEAMRSLSELDGRGVSEELVAEIFSHFCVGK